jgi:transposase
MVHDRPGVEAQGGTLFLLWQEYRETHPEGYQYSWFCEHFRAWHGRLVVVIREDYRAGEKLFVDYAGQMVAVVDRFTGEIREAQVFVAALGVSKSPVTGAPARKDAILRPRRICPRRTAKPVTGRLSGWRTVPLRSGQPRKNAS